MNRYVLFPFRGGALVLLLTFTLGQELALHAGWAGLPLAVALLSWFFKYCFILLDSIVVGAAEPPVLSVEMINPINEQRPLGQALLIAGGCALCWALGTAMPVLGWLTAALLLLLLPASIATLGMTGHLLRAAWPPELWSVIRDVGRDYLLLVVAIPGLALLFFMLGHYGANSWVLIGGGQLSFLLAFALIGSVLHEHRLELGIEYRTLQEHIAERTEREHASERNRMMDHAYMKFRVGKPLEGWQVDKAARNVIEKAGYGKYFFHRTGHSIGERVHGNGVNMDGLETHDSRHLIPRTCNSVEPGVYLSEFGIRSEVNVYIDEGEARVTGAVQNEILALLA